VTYAVPFATSPPVVAFANSTYTVPIAQNGGGGRVVFYNSVADTGTVSMRGNQSVARTTASLASGGTLPTRGLAGFRNTTAIPTNGIYVKYDASRLTQRIEQMEKNAGATGGYDVLSSVAAVRGRIVAPRDGQDVRQLAAQLVNQPGVVGVYPLHYRYALATTPTRTPPSDADFGLNAYQWDLDAIQALYAWSLTTSLGANAKVAIIDTGIDLTHPDLKPNIKYEASAVNGVLTVNQGQAQDTQGHGTNVAGIAAAYANDPQGTGFAGVAPHAQIYGYRIFPPATSTSDGQTASTGDEVLAITDAVSQKVDVINLSLGSPAFDPAGGPGFDQAEHDAIENAIASGVTVVAASGNGDANNIAQSTIDFPAAYDGVLAIGASAIADNNVGSWAPATGVFAGTSEVVASFSNYGPGLTIVAPGGDTGTSADSSTSDNLHWIVNDSTQTAAYASDKCTIPALPLVCASKFQGTSQATPHVSGTIALIQSALVEKGMSKLAPAAMVQLLEGTADNINSPYQGHGRLNTLRALAGGLGLTLVSAPTPPPSSPTQFVAFAYTNIGGSGKPAIADVTYPAGVPVSSGGTFRIADIDPSKTTGAYRIAVWLDTNGDGIVDAGDQFGASSVTCIATQTCNPGTITVSVVTANPLTLP
jgi:subtilisin family serine protease